MIKREPDKFKKDIMYTQKKEINHATIKVSWDKRTRFCIIDRHNDRE